MTILIIAMRVIMNELSITRNDSMSRLDILSSISLYSCVVAPSRLDLTFDLKVAPFCKNVDIRAESGSRALVASAKLRGRIIAYRAALKQCRIIELKQIELLRGSVCNRAND